MKITTAMFLLFLRILVVLLLGYQVYDKEYSKYISFRRQDIVKGYYEDVENLKN